MVDHLVQKIRARSLLPAVRLELESLVDGQAGTEVVRQILEKLLGFELDGFIAETLAPPDFPGQRNFDRYIVEL